MGASVMSSERYLVGICIYHPLRVCSSRLRAMEGLARACSLSATQLFAGYLLPTQYMYDAQTCNATNHQVYMSFMPKTPCRC